jgi:hypothetical protein
MSTHYFAADGSYGTSNIIVIDTTDWSPEEWEIVDNATDQERISIAYQISENAKPTGEWAQLPLE